MTSTSSCLVNLTGPCCLTDAERHVCHFSPKQQVVTLPSLSVIYLSLWDKHATLITQVSSPSLHELMSTNIRSFHVHFSIGTLCLLKYVSSSTRCLQASQLIWSTKPWHSSGKGWRPLLDICWRTGFNRKCTKIGLRYGNRISGSARTFGYFCTRVPVGYLNGYPGTRCFG